MNEKAPGTALAVQSHDFMPVFEMNVAIDRRNAVVDFVKQLMKEGIDYGKIPGIDKPTLLKPGAEKLVTFFGLSPEFVTTAEVEDWTGTEHRGEAFFYYRYKCRLLRGERVIGEGEGSANSWESKHRYRWASAEQVKDRSDKDRLTTRGGVRTMFEPDFALTKKETTGKYGKADAYWKMFEDAIARSRGETVPMSPETARFAGLDLGQPQAPVAVRTTKKMGQREYTGWAISVNELQYRIPNADAADTVNTLQKMAQKRALVAAVLIGVNASEFFTQDVEDLAPIEGTATVVAEPAAAPAKDQPKPEVKAAAPASEKASDEFFEDDGILKLKECDNIGDLTKVFNSMPVDVRRPGTKVFKAFSERREQLTPPGKKKPAQQEAQ